jgi:hypothetical protein
MLSLPSPSLILGRSPDWHSDPGTYRRVGLTWSIEIGRNVKNCPGLLAHSYRVHGIAAYRTRSPNRNHHSCRGGSLDSVLVSHLWQWCPAEANCRCWRGWGESRRNHLARIHTTKPTGNDTTRNVTIAQEQKKPRRNNDPRTLRPSVALMTNPKPRGPALEEQLLRFARNTETTTGSAFPPFFIEVGSAQSRLDDDPRILHRL